MLPSPLTTQSNTKGEKSSRPDGDFNLRYTLTEKKHQQLTQTHTGKEDWGKRDYNERNVHKYKSPTNCLVNPIDPHTQADI
jgi:hypothetical protein